MGHQKQTDKITFSSREIQQSDMNHNIVYTAKLKSRLKQVTTAEM